MTHRHRLRNHRHYRHFQRPIPSGLVYLRGQVQWAVDNNMLLCTGKK